MCDSCQVAATVTNPAKGHYPPTALQTSKSLAKAAKALEAQEVLKKKQVCCIFREVVGGAILSFLWRTLSFFISGGIKAPTGHEEEEAGDVKDTDRMSEGNATCDHTFPPSSHFYFHIIVILLFQALINRLEKNRGMKPEERANIMKTLKELTEKIAQLQNEMSHNPASQVSHAKPNHSQPKTKTDVSLQTSESL